MPVSRIGPVVALGLALLIALSGCGKGSDDRAATSAPTSAATTAATPTPDPSPTPPATTMTPQSPSPSAPAPSALPPAKGWVGQCGAFGATRTRLEALAPKQTRVADGQGSALAVTTIGAGPTVVILLHQASGGSCGWQYFLARAGSDPRFRFVVPDLCGAGSSVCVGELDGDRTAQTQLVLDWVAKTSHPRRTVAVGASMGGAVALHAAAVGLPLDAVVDISGPVGYFPDHPLADDVRGSSIPLRLVYDPDDDAQGAAMARHEAAADPGRVEYVEVHDGHGWETLVDGHDALTATARAVLDFAAGR